MCFVCVHVCVCVCVRESACVCMCVCVCVQLTVSETAWFLRLSEMQGPITPHTFSSLGHYNRKSKKIP